MVNDLLFVLAVFSFAVVSVAVSIKFLMEAWCEYIAAKEGIRIIREQLEEEEEEEVL
jgi:hypothetical protein